MTNILQKVQKLAVKKPMPNIEAGYTVKVHQRIKEGEKERTQIFEGLVIKVNSGFGADKTFTVRKIVDGIGVEKIFPLYSSNIIKIEIKKKAKVRRSKLYYMRKRSGKSARMKESLVSEKEMEEVMAKMVEEYEKEKKKNEEDEKKEVVETNTETVEEATEVEEKAEEPKKAEDEVKETSEEKTDEKKEDKEEEKKEE